MKFKADSKKVVRLGSGKLAVFKSGSYETSDKDEIASLKKAKGVVEVKAEVKTESKTDTKK